jgi:hypothetical protein
LHRADGRRVNPRDAMRDRRKTLHGHPVTRRVASTGQGRRCSHFFQVLPLSQIIRVDCSELTCRGQSRILGCGCSLIVWHTAIRHPRQSRGHDRWMMQDAVSGLKQSAWKGTLRADDCLLPFHQTAQFELSCQQPRWLHVSPRIPPEDLCLA